MTGLPILNYHGIESHEAEFSWLPGERIYALDKSVFQSQFDQLTANGFVSLSLKQLGEWMGKGIASVASPPRDDIINPLMLTFDDGHISHFKYAAPLLNHKRLKAVFFVSAGIVGKKDKMGWFHLKQLIREGFEIGSHGMTHIPLTRLSKEKLVNEIGASKQKLEDKLGVPISSFSVPCGFFGPGIRKVAEESGYQFIFTSQFGVNQAHKRAQTPFCLKRLAIKHGTTLKSFTEMIHGRLGLSGTVEGAKNVARRFVSPSIYESLANFKSRFELRSVR